MTLPVDSRITEPETVQAIGYENDDGTLYGYANHKSFEGNPCGIQVRIIRESDYQEMKLAATARDATLEKANKLWRLCVDEGFPWADGSTQDTLTEIGLLYPKDMTTEDESERCTNCDDDCHTCYRAVEKVEDAK